MNQVFTNESTLYSCVREQVGKVDKVDEKLSLVGVQEMGKDMVKGLNIIK